MSLKNVIPDDLIARRMHDRPVDRTAARSPGSTYAQVSNLHPGVYMYLRNRDQPDDIIAPVKHRGQ